MEQNSNFGFMRHLLDTAELTKEEMSHISGMLKKCTTSFNWKERARDGEEECTIELKKGYATTLSRLFENKWEIIVVRKFNLIIDWCGESITLQLLGPNNEVIEYDFIDLSNKFNVNTLSRGWAFNRYIDYAMVDEYRLKWEKEARHVNVAK